MKNVLKMTLYLTVAVVLMGLVMVLGAIGGWYLAWILGTSTTVLIAAASGALFDAQEEDRDLSSGPANQVQGS